MLDHIEPIIEQDTQFDIIAGSAGCLVTLLALYSVRPTPKTLEMAIQCGYHIIAHATPMSMGVAWKTDDSPALGGFSHGVSGIAWALFRLADVTKDKRYAETAVEALKYEQTLYSAEHHNWRNLRRCRRGDSRPCVGDNARSPLRFVYTCRHKLRFVGVK